MEGVMPIKPEPIHFQTHFDSVGNIIIEVIGDFPQRAAISETMLERIPFNRHLVIHGEKLFIQCANGIAVYQIAEPMQNGQYRELSLLHKNVWDGEDE
jgi:hypothetical protein